MVDLKGGKVFTILIAFIVFPVFYLFLIENEGYVHSVMKPFISLVAYPIAHTVTYSSLWICIVTVAATLSWYPYARRKFSSPIKHVGILVVGLILWTLMIVTFVQVYLTIFDSGILHQVSYFLFTLSLGMTLVRDIATLSTAAVHKKLEQSANPACQGDHLVTVIVPAYNEEKVIGKTVEAILNLSYPNKELIVVDDGSTDKTAEVLKCYDKCGMLRVITKPNGGKWSALNTGIKAAKGEYIICIDADTLLNPDAIQHLIKHFKNLKVGAVAGNVKVGNRGGIITKLQALEYVIGINTYRRSEAFFQKVTIVPGAIGAFRASALKEVGLYEGDTFAEDADTTLKILKADYEVVYEPKAIGYTEAPSNMTDLAKQRYRWYRGLLQCLSKHKDMIFNSKRGSTGPLVMSWAVFNGIVYPWLMFFALMWLLVLCINPLSVGKQPLALSELFNFTIGMDFLKAVSSIYVLWFLIFLALEVLIAAYAISIDGKEKPYLVLYVIIDRLFYVYMIGILRILSQLEQAFHYPMRWEKAERYGAVEALKFSGSDLSVQKVERSVQKHCIKSHLEEIKSWK